MRWIRITAPSTLAVLLGCSAAVTWKETCGCIPDWANLAMELNIDVAESGTTLTPKMLEDTLKTRFGKERVELVSGGGGLEAVHADDVTAAIAR
jgi:hypothetical protein